MNKTLSSLLTIVITALLAGSAVYLWQNQEPAQNPSTDEKPEETSTEEPSSMRYEDDFLSFNYPSNMNLLLEQTGEGWAMSRLNWVRPSENGQHLEMLGIQNPELSYPLYLEGEGYSSWEELKAAQLNANTDELSTVESLSIAGQDAILKDGSGFCEHHYQVYIEGPEEAVYSLNAGCLNQEDWTQLYNIFVESVEFKQ